DDLCEVRLGNPPRLADREWARESGSSELPLDHDQRGVRQANGQTFLAGGSSWSAGRQRTAARGGLILRATVDGCRYRLASQVDCFRPTVYTEAPSIPPSKEERMSLIAWIVLGIIAGFLGSKIVNRTGEGLVRDLILGIVGAIVGGWIFSLFGQGGVTGLN